MGNTKEGAAKALATMRSRHGDDWFSERARKAGKHSKGTFKKGDRHTIAAARKGGKTKAWKQSNGGQTS